MPRNVAGKIWGGETYGVNVLFNLWQIIFKAFLSFRSSLKIYCS